MGEVKQRWRRRRHRAVRVGLRAAGWLLDREAANRNARRFHRRSQAAIEDVDCREAGLAAGGTASTSHDPPLPRTLVGP